MKQELIQKRLREKFLKQGVKMISPETVFFSNKTKIGKNVSIEPYVVFAGKVVIQNNVTVKSFSHLEDVRINNNVLIGPYARLRPGTILEDNTKIGNFVEIKKSIIGHSSKINHLSYIGDTRLGNNTNIGAGTITANFDGKNKHQTIIGDHSKTGANSVLVAPIKIGANVTIGAGSTVSKNIPDKSLVVERSKAIIRSKSD